MPRTHRHRRSQPTGKPRWAADRHRYPVCPATGKRRLGERKDVVLALAAAKRARARADLHGVPTNRQEVRGYRCASCRGWHLTSRTGHEHIAAGVNGPHGKRSIRNDGHADTPRRVPAPRSPAAASRRAGELQRYPAACPATTPAPAGRVRGAASAGDARG